jgi:hypothetical protein
VTVLAWIAAILLAFLAVDVIAFGCLVALRSHNIRRARQQRSDIDQLLADIEDSLRSKP